VTLHAFVQTMKVDAGRQQLMNVIDEARNALQTYYTLDDMRGSPTAFHLQTGRMDHGGVSEMVRGTILSSSISMRWLSKDAMPNDRIQFSNLLEVTPAELMKFIEETFNGGASIDLSKFMSMQFWQQKPVANIKFPSLAVLETTEVATERFTGTDQIQRSFAAVVRTFWGTGEDETYTLLNLAEIVRDFILKYYRWRARAVDTLLSSISYESPQENSQMVLTATIPFGIKCREAVKYVA
jgi:hypothetical protein